MLTILYYDWDYNEKNPQSIDKKYVFVGIASI